MKQDLTPLFKTVNGLKTKFNAELDKRFSPEKREEIKDRVVDNLLLTKSILEQTAKNIAKDSKDTKIVKAYLRPLVQSHKTEQALNQLEGRLAPAKPLVQTIRDLRTQFLDLTATVEIVSEETKIDKDVEELQATEEESSNTSTKRKRSKSKSKSQE